MPELFNAKVGAIRTGPVLAALMKDGDIPLDFVSLTKVGAVMLQAVKDEAKKDFAKVGKAGLSNPFGLPDSNGKRIRPSFFDSFSIKISGARTLEIVSSWPWIEGLIEGRPRAAMTKHTQLNPKLRNKPIPFMGIGGKVIFRMAPLAFGKIWVHPGIAKHTFIQRGLAKARTKLREGMMAKILLEQLQRNAK
jgi:hypothetical protein